MLGDSAENKEVVMDAMLTRHLEISGIDRIDFGKTDNEYSAKLWEKILQSLHQIFSLAALMIYSKEQHNQQHSAT